MTADRAAADAVKGVGEFEAFVAQEPRSSDVGMVRNRCGEKVFSLEISEPVLVPCQNWTVTQLLHFLQRLPLMALTLI